MDRTLHIGYSPCPNDTFIFFALAQGRIDVEPYRLDISLADVEVLNERAWKHEADVSKVSISAVARLLDEYWLLRAGGAVGRGCGPLIVARRFTTMEELLDRTLAIPGKMTTAHLLLQIHGGHRGRRVQMPFDQIMPAIAQGKVDGGVIIHEGRFTYPSMGLRLVLDLGQWWEDQTGLPLPLGGIAMKRRLGSEAARFMEEKIRQSMAYARLHPDEAWPYIRFHAQEMDARVIRQHIDMFVNDFSHDLGPEGESAIRFLLEAASRQSGSPLPGKPVFWENSQ